MLYKYKRKFIEMHKDLYSRQNPFIIHNTTNATVLLATAEKRIYKQKNRTKFVFVVCCMKQKLLLQTFCI